MNEMHDKRKKIDHTRGRNQGLDQNLSEEDEGSERKVFGEVKRHFLPREKERNEN